ncbi:hypothetical protein [Tenacibaculum aquimarinum]|uniref:hypothetical protein n=1 Tax=Tenacibaculum aquimarinum TaxID=2910675 RepID=UPI001F0A9264|nr:hypothetical protein [Tenacibaculum aquimarinum]MCH3884878.1 hypothetical protein [Tenacibaculum aquimarinum]
MKTNKEIQNKVEDTFKVLDTIEKVDVNHFFKHKVLQKLNAEKKERNAVFSWFTPQFQLATLSLVLLLNALVILYAFNNSTINTSSDIETFAQEYSLQSTSDSILN